MKRISGFFIYCDCAQETNNSAESLIYFPNEYNRTEKCQHCGKVFKAEVKEIPAGLALYVWEEEANESNN